MLKAAAIALLAFRIGAGAPAGNVTVPVTAPVTAPPPPVSRIVLDDSPGGDVGTFLGFYQAIKASHAPVELRGMCMSACTLVLILPRSQVCIDKTASLGFHLAAVNDVPDAGMTGALVRRYYPPPVQVWLKSKTLTADLTWMDYDTITALGIFAPCKE